MEFCRYGDRGSWFHADGQVCTNLIKSLSISAKSSLFEVHDGPMACSLDRFAYSIDYSIGPGCAGVSWSWMLRYLDVQFETQLGMQHHAAGYVGHPDSDRVWTMFGTKDETSRDHSWHTDDCELERRTDEQRSRKVAEERVRHTSTVDGLLTLTREQGQWTMFLYIYIGLFGQPTGPGLRASMRIRRDSRSLASALEG